VKKKRGGQRRHWADKARILAWYFEVKGRCDWSDYELDMEFAWKPEVDDKSRSTDNRPRVFEWIRKKARKPSASIQWRSMEELLDAVENHPQFQGTKQIYESGFWSLAKIVNPSPGDIENLVANLLSKHGLIRINPIQEPELSMLVQRKGITSVLNQCLSVSLNEMDHFSQLELLWALYLQAESAPSWEIRSLLESFFDERADIYFQRYLQKQHWDFYVKAINGLRGTRLNLPSSVGQVYDNFGGISEHVILPKAFLKEFNAENLRKRAFILQSALIHVYLDGSP